ncbi:MAG: hypothetical protein J7497_12145 [Chitinophagaceae bacterium]|nr:hypothetical protein [Chitinophagaceae bacterium]
MKKLFAIMAVAGILVACNDGGKQEEPKGDSTATAAPAPAAPDSTATPKDSTVKDSTAAPKDSAAAKH